MLLDCGYKFIDNIDKELLSTVQELCLKLDWNNSIFERFEPALSKGKFIALPVFLSSNTEYHTPEVKKIVDEFRPIVDLVMSYYPDCRVLKGEIAYLPSITRLGLHIDERWVHKHSHRIHVPIITNSRCFQIFQNRSAHLELGKIYEINNRIPHSAVNNGNKPRIHLILDVCPNIKCVDITAGSALNIEKSPVNGKEVD